MSTSKGLHRRHCNAFDAILSDEQRWELFEVSKRSPWYETAKFLKSEYDLEVSRSAIYAWQKQMSSMESQRRLEKAIMARKEIKDLSQAGEIDLETADAYIALANDALLSGDAEQASRIVSSAMAISAAALKKVDSATTKKRLEIQEEQMKLAREKFEAAEKRLNATQAVISDGALSPEEKERRLKEVFGL